MDLGQLSRKFDQSALGFNRAFANVAVSQTDAAIVAAVPKNKIRVHAISIQCAGTGTISTFKTKPAGGGTDISRDYPLAANGGAVENFNPAGWFETDEGEGLSIDTGAGSVTSVQVIYSLVRNPATT